MAEPDVPEAKIVAERCAELARVRKRGGEPAAPKAALIEAAGQEEHVLESSGSERLPWQTQQIDRAKLQEYERLRMEQLAELSQYVSESSSVHELVKSSRNDSPHICVGRAKRNDIVLQDPAISSVHAHLEENSGRYYLVDLSSSNGTFINQTQLEGSSPVVLQSGDCVRFGTWVFYYLNGERLLQFLEMRLVRPG